MQRFLGIILLVSLAIAALTAQWWLTSLLGFLGAQDESMQNLSAFVQMLIWLGAALVFIMQRIQRRRRHATSESAPASSSSHKEIKTLGTNAQSVVVNAPLQGDIIGPHAIKIEKIVQHASPELERQKREQGRRLYLENLSRSCQALPLAALGGEEGAEEELSLNHVYIALDTETRVAKSETEKKKRSGRAEALAEPDKETRPLSALEATAQASRLVLLGQPDAGKSTFVRMLLAWQAAA